MNDTNIYIAIIINVTNRLIVSKIFHVRIQSSIIITLSLPIKWFYLWWIIIYFLMPSCGILSNLKDSFGKNICAIIKISDVDSEQLNKRWNSLSRIVLYIHIAYLPPFCRPQNGDFSCFMRTDRKHIDVVNIYERKHISSWLWWIISNVYTI